MPSNWSRSSAARSNATIKQTGKPVIAVDLYTNKVTDADLKELKELKQLKALKLSSARSDGRGPERIEGTQTTHIAAPRCEKVTDAGMKELKELKQLTELNLSGTKVTDAGVKELKELKQLTELTSATPR